MGAGKERRKRCTEGISRMERARRAKTDVLGVSHGLCKIQAHLSYLRQGQTSGEDLSVGGLGYLVGLLVVVDGDQEAKSQCLEEAEVFHDRNHWGYDKNKITSASTKVHQIPLTACRSHTEILNGCCKSSTNAVGCRLFLDRDGPTTSYSLG